jgi:hypothetical protein
MKKKAKNDGKRHSLPDSSSLIHENAKKIRAEQTARVFGAWIDYT